MVEPVFLWRRLVAAQIRSQLQYRVSFVLYAFGSFLLTVGDFLAIWVIFHHVPVLEGWSLALSEINYLRTGYATRGLLDVHIITDEDIARKTSYAVKIGALTDAARPLALGSV